MKPHAALLIGILFLGTVFSFRDGTAQAAQEATGWTPDKTAVKQLGPEVSRERFIIRVPSGYSPIEQPGPGDAKAYAWYGAARADGTKPYVMIVVATPPPDETKKYAPEEILDVFMRGVERRRSDWARGATEYGVVNGLSFVRARWSGVDQATGSKMKGFMYVTSHRGQVIQIASQDVESYADESLKIAEASALTFRVQ